MFFIKINLKKKFSLTTFDSKNLKIVYKINKKGILVMVIRI